MKIAAIQMRSGTDVAANIAAASDLIRSAAQDGAAFVATPEMTHLLQKDSDVLRLNVRAMEEDAGVAAFGALAEELEIHLLIGSLAILGEGGQIANRSLLFAPDGSLATQYDKIHLFEADLSSGESYRESDTYASGLEPVCAHVDDLNVGLSICYDVRFPALYSHYAQQQVDLIAVPAAFTVPTGKAHWETLLRARAIETGAYIVAPAQGGMHEDGRKTWGRTMIIGPWGDVMTVLDNDEPGFISAKIDKSQVETARARLPAWRGSIHLGVMP